MLKLLSQDTTGASPFPRVCNPTLSHLRGLKTLGGNSLDGNFPSLRFVAEDGYESLPGLCDYFTSGLLNIFSGKMRLVLQQIGAELEFFPVIVEYKGRETTTEYFVGNLLRRFNGVDLSRSIVELDDELGDALSVEILALDEAKFEGVKMSVVAEIQRIAVSEEVITAIQNAGCTGCMFVDAFSVHY